MLTCPGCQKVQIFDYAVSAWLQRSVLDAHTLLEGEISAVTQGLSVIEHLTIHGWK